jgi:cellulose synthase (UDP-forming)
MTARKMLLLLTTAAIWVYLGWRVLKTLPDGYGLIFGLVLLLAEGVQAIQSTIFHIILLNPTKRTPPPIPDQSWTVDIFVTTYSESPEILNRTLVACKNLEYPADKLHIWLCDDGRREDMRHLSEELGIGYISRPSNEHAKAGNLNNALKHTTSELIVTLDADMIPKPEFLKRTVGFFRDINVAFVQTPQSFFNEDIFQYNLFQSRDIPNEQDLFMRIIQAGRDRFNSTIYVGSNTVFRRNAIESIGGFATGTITEDIATGMLLQSKGYQTIFFNEVLVQGLAAESFADFLIQRIRWARGTIQTARKWNPLTLKGLTLMQRVLYLSAIIYWYNGLFKFIFILSPLVFLLLGIPVLKASITGLLLFWIPQFVLSGVVFRVNTDNARNLYWSHLYDMAAAPAVLWAVIVETIARKPITFKVTPKGVLTQSVHFDKRLVAAHIFLLVLSVIGIIRGGTILFYGSMVSGAVLINLFWTAYNVMGLIPSVMMGWERPRLRNTERFKRTYIATLKTEGEIYGKCVLFGKTLDVSESGCRVLFRQLVPLPEKLTVIIHGYKRHEIQSRVVYFDSHEDGFQVGLKFELFSPESFKKWVWELYAPKPDESLFKLHPGNSWLSIYYKYLSNFRLRYKAKTRSSPRIPMKISCQLQVFPSAYLPAIEETAATKEPFFDRNIDLPVYKTGEISNIGLGGCEVRLNSIKCNIGDLVILKLPEINSLITGILTRVNVSDNQNTVLGIKWINKAASLHLIEELTIIRQENLNN